MWTFFTRNRWLDKMGEVLPHRLSAVHLFRGEGRGKGRDTCTQTHSNFFYQYRTHIVVWGWNVVVFYMAGAGEGTGKSQFFHLTGRTLGTGSDAQLNSWMRRPSTASRGLSAFSDQTKEDEKYERNFAIRSIRFLGKVEKFPTIAHC